MKGLILLLLYKFNFTKSETVHGKWSDWSGWSTCSVTCGGTDTTVYKTRSCTHLPAYGGEYCPGSNVARKSCGRNSCPDWAPWGAWDTCGTVCGEGWKTRRRKCVNNGKNIDVKMCQGNPSLYEQCHITSCQGDIGGKLFISCRDSSHVTWYNDKQQPIYNNRKKYTLTNAYLTIDNLKYEDDGKYKCVSQYHTGEFTDIRIQGHPAIQLNKDTYYANIGSSKTIHCIIVHSNPAVVSLWWTKLNSTRHTTSILSDPGKYSGGTLSTPDLTINRINDTDNGTYACHANNSYGTSTVTTHVIVGDVAVVDIPQDYYVSREGESVTLQCTVQNGKGATLTWKKGRQILRRINSIYSRTTAESPSLIISNVETRDNGAYYCIVASSFGDVSDSTELRVVRKNFVGLYTIKLYDMYWTN